MDGSDAIHKTYVPYSEIELLQSNVIIKCTLPGLSPSSPPPPPPPHTHTHTPVIQAGNHIQILHKLAVGLALSINCRSALRDGVVCLLTLLQVLHLTQQCHQLQEVEQQLSLMQLLKEQQWLLHATSHSSSGNVVRRLHLHTCSSLKAVKHKG